MELKMLNANKTVTLADEVFACAFNEPLVHQVVTAHRASDRAGTKAQKTRSMVSGGGVKPWRQKGTGQARAGTIRSPLWRKGGKVFAAVPRDYTQKVNKKMHRIALRSILSELIRQERLNVVEQLTVEAPKTKDLVKQLNEMKVTGPVFLMTESFDRNLALSARNLPHVQLCHATLNALDPVMLIKAEKMIVTAAALKVLEGLLK
jgi:large subunit ribosomal protein L4